MIRHQDFENIGKDGIEKVDYDVLELPVYIRDGRLSELKDYTFKAHYHSDWEFIAVLEGHMEYSVNGKVIRLEPGDSLFVNSNPVHFGFSTLREECKYICLIVHPSLFCNNPYIERNYISPICGSGYEYLIIKDPDVHSRIADIYNKKLQGQPNLYFSIQSDLFCLAEAVYKLIDRLPKADAGHQDFGGVRAMLDFIAKNYGEKITLPDIAKSANVCKNSCIAIFKKFTNFTPIEYLNNYRIEQACVLLRETDKTVAQIALDCGFSACSYFGEIFKRSKGITPKDYRTRLRRQTDEQHNSI